MRNRENCYVMLYVTLCYASSWSKEASDGKCECKGVEVLKRWQEGQGRYRAGQGGRKGARALGQSRKGRRKPQVHSSGTPTRKDWSWRV